MPWARIHVFTVSFYANSCFDFVIRVVFVFRRNTRGVPGVTRVLQVFARARAPRALYLSVGLIHFRVSDFI